MAESDGEQGLGASSVVDVTSIPLSDLGESANSALLQSIRLILGDLDASADSISGWASYLDSDSTIAS